MIIPVITGATGIVTKGLKKKLEAINRKTFNRFSKKRQPHITQNTESTAV
jgi:hypothetical protein